MRLASVKFGSVNRLDSNRVSIFSKVSFQLVIFSSIKSVLISTTTATNSLKSRNQEEKEKSLAKVKEFVE